MSDTPPDVERMTAAEFRVVREFLGLTLSWLAEHFKVNERTVPRWESGESPVPAGVAAELKALDAQTANTVTLAINACKNMRGPALRTYRTDADYRAHHPEFEFPASWHRAFVARVAQEVPGLVIDYWQPVERGRFAGATRVRNRVTGTVRTRVPGTNGWTTDDYPGEVVTTSQLEALSEMEEG
jgi:hypothetical protein